jgi:hypothetical protein
MTIGLARLYGSSHLYCPSKKKQLFSHCRLSGIRVRNNRKGTPVRFEVTQNAYPKEKGGII